MSNSNSQESVWYVGYGTNLSEQRFLCYIRGGMPIFGMKRNNGCRNRDYPLDSRACKIPYPLYFALPDGIRGTGNWGVGGVGFVSPNKREDEKDWTLGRMWKITREQYEDIRQQEGSKWYDKEILLGIINEGSNIPIYTITSGDVLTNITAPSVLYLNTIISGLRESHNLRNEEILDYLISMDGIRGNFERDELMGIIIRER